MKSITTFAITFLALSLGACPVRAQDDAGIRIRVPDVDIQIDLKGERAQRVERAKAILVPIGDSGVSGTVYFNRADDSIKITGTVEGLEPGRHGFHVHRFGDLSDCEKGLSAGGHFDPTDSKHGAPDEEERHIGDLGNITANEEGVAKIKKEDSVIRLNGRDSIVGRSIVVHAEADEFTQPSGDAGARVAFGVIGIAGPKEGDEGEK